MFSKPLATARVAPSEEMAPADSGEGKRGYCLMRFLARGSQMERMASPPREANVAWLQERLEMWQEGQI